MRTINNVPSPIITWKLFSFISITINTGRLCLLTAALSLPPTIPFFATVLDLAWYVNGLHPVLHSYAHYLTPSQPRLLETYTGFKLSSALKIMSEMCDTIQTYALKKSSIRTKYAKFLLADNTPLVTDTINNKLHFKTISEDQENNSLALIEYADSKLKQGIIPYAANITVGETQSERTNKKQPNNHSTPTDVTDSTETGNDNVNTNSQQTDEELRNVHSEPIDSTNSNQNIPHESCSTPDDIWK